MRFSANLLKITAPVLLALLLLSSAPGCNNRVVVGRSAEKSQQPAEKPSRKSEEKAPQKAQGAEPAQPKPAPTETAKAPEQAKEQTAAKAEASLEPEPKPVPGGMMGLPKSSGNQAPSGGMMGMPKSSDSQASSSSAGGMTALPAKPSGEQAAPPPAGDQAAAPAPPAGQTAAPAPAGDQAAPPPPPAEQTAKVEPMSSPARPQPPKEEKAKAMPAPYKLDISFGGFGLGVGLLNTPVGVAVDVQENIYVVDQGNYRIQKFDRFGIHQFEWGRQGMGDGEFVEQKVNVDGTPTLTLRETGEFEFNKPIGILLDTDDFRNLIRITVVDSLNHRIQRFLLTQNPGDQFPDAGPTNVFVMLPKGEPSPIPDPELKNKYTTERRQVILDPVYISKANNFLLAPFIWGKLGYSQGLLNAPTYITKDDSGIFYVADTENARVQGFYVTPSNPSTDATFYREWGNAINLQYGAGRLNQPTAIEFDNSGFGGFLVLDKLPDGTYNIQRFDRQGQFLGVFAASGDKEGQFKQPVALAVNPFDNTVYVTDRGRKKVMVYSNKGEFLYEFGGDELADPRGIAVLRNSYVYVTDAAKNMVYRYVPQ